MLFHSLFASLRTPSARCRNQGGRAARFRPAIESLDERCLPCAGLSATLSAPPAALDSAAHQNHDQPFHLSGAGSFTPVSPTEATFTASGTATALGRWTNYGELHFDGNHGTGIAVFTAANGDVLVAIADGMIDFVTGAATGTFTFVSSATFDGAVFTSTGRFADVSGLTSLDALGFPDFTFTLSGDLSYSASHHAGSQSGGSHAGSTGDVIEAARHGVSTKHPHCPDGLWSHGECIYVYW